ncbi:SRPBCC domain-containing protein [Streptomyces sp. NPDC012637]|uniref:SRPBCC domain-containing protein n=1 Tax=Streptomyces sp. NPDC012637 TaxID=3364842 RepID=UPI0036E15289
MSEIPRGRAETHDGNLQLRYVIELPHPMVSVWAAVATPEGLPQWLCAADPLEPRLGGRVTLRWFNSDTVLSGRVTAWDMENVAEYTVDPGHQRIRFHLEPATVLRFTHEFRGTRDEKLNMLAGWHEHFERLARALDGHPTNWLDWTEDRRRELRELYELDDAPWPKWVP